MIILCRTASNEKFKFLQDGVRQNDNGGANMLWMTIEYVLVIDGYQWLWMVIDGYGWLSMVINICGCLSMVNECAGWHLTK